MSLEIILPKKKFEGPCVLKIWIGNKFYIANTHNMLWLRTKIETLYEQYVTQGADPKEMHFVILKEIHKLNQKRLSKQLKSKKPKTAEPLQITFELLFNSASGYKMLKYALETFAKDYGHRNCINPSNVPYLPNTFLNKNGDWRYTWLTPSDAANYEKLLKKYDIEK